MGSGPTEPWIGSAAHSPQEPLTQHHDVAGSYNIRLNLTATPLAREEAAFLFKVVAKRYDREKPIIVTSNKSWGAWGKILPDQVMTAAILDRLLHRSVTVNIRGESYRLRQHRRAGLLPRPVEESRKEVKADSDSQ